VPGRLELREQSLGGLSHPQLDRREQEEPRAGGMREQPLDRLIHILPA